MSPRSTLVPRAISNSLIGIKDNCNKHLNRHVFINSALSNGNVLSKEVVNKLFTISDLMPETKIESVNLCAYIPILMFICVKLSSL